jgi:hypothetical protein
MSPKSIFCRRVYRRRPSTSVIRPAAITRITMTVASASTEVRVSCQLVQSSSMLWPSSPASVESAPSTEKIPLSKGRGSATENAMLRFVARVLIARQHDLCRTGVEAATIRSPQSSDSNSRRAAVGRTENVIGRVFRDVCTSSQGLFGISDSLPLGADLSRKFFAFVA